MIAKFTRADIMRVDHDESKMLAQAMADVASQYDAIAMSPKAQAWVAFAGTLGVVYGPRIAVLVMPKKASVHPIAQQATGTFDASQLTSIPGQ